MVDLPDDGVRDAYVRAVIAAYVATPGVHGHVRRVDRDVAARLCDARVPFHVVRTAFLLAAARRIRNNAFTSPLPTIRSLHYFLPVIREVQERPLGYRDVAAIREIFGNSPD